LRPTFNDNVITSKRQFSICILFAAFLFAGVLCVPGQGVKRVVVLKIDGLPGYFVDKHVKERDPETGRSVLPWFEEVFYRNGTRLSNFYTRGMSLSAPAWGQLDTGQHLQIKGNVEFDRLTMHAYDYLNFFPYYIQYGLKKKMDMPAVEVLDQLNIPLLYDAFPYEKRYISHQLYQRANEWEVLASGFVKLYPGNVEDFIDEWTMGLDFRRVTINQVERDIVGKLVKRPDIDYYDLYDASFDHVAHHNNDVETRLKAVKDVDRTIGRIWTAIQSSSRADETALILVSDHGFNAEPKVYSQGFNLVHLLTGRAGGGHHVVTKRRLMLDYSIKGIYPLVPLIKTASKNSYYLKGQHNEYPTALLDFDGNERASIQLRDSDINVLHILLQQLQGKLSNDVRAAATETFFQTVDRHRPEWEKLVEQLTEELAALRRQIAARQAVIDAQPQKYTPEQVILGVDKEDRRIAALHALDVEAEAAYHKYLTTLDRLLSLKRDGFDPRHIKAEDVIAAGAMGDLNTLYDLQNYVAGPAMRGLTVSDDKRLDPDKSFTRVNYFDLLHAQRVRNNVQPDVSNRPIDITAVRIPAESLVDALPEELAASGDAVWIYGGPDKQALILSRSNRQGERSFFYLPVAHLSQGADGKITFRRVDWSDGLPLKYFEDEALAIKRDEREAWLGQWHTEIEWMNAIHRTTYSNGLIDVYEQLARHPVFDPDDGQISPDERLMRRFRQRQRRLSETDLLIVANDHWNFDVKGFNPGGNHGSFFRVSTNATLMMAGGSTTGIPRGLNVDTPYDSLSFGPTLMRLMGKIDDENRPNQQLTELGFRKFPGRVISEVINNPGTSQK
jgi:hypothetical protein